MTTGMGVLEVSWSCDHDYYSGRIAVLGMDAKFLILAVLIWPSSGAPSVNCASTPFLSYDYCNPSLSPEARADDLVSRLTLSEVVAQSGSSAPAISRLGINAYNWRSNCVHGWSLSGGAWPSGTAWTVFPAPIGLAASFDKKLVLQVSVWRTVTKTREND